MGAFSGDSFTQSVERRMKEWQENQEAAAHHLSDGARINYITLSRQLGAGGEEVAEELAKLMGWSVFDKRIVNFMAENFGVHADVLETVDERTRGWIEDSISMFFSNKKGSEHLDQYSYYKHLIEALLVIAQHGRAIIVGRAAGQVLPRDHGLSIRITAPFELRAERVAAQNKIKVSEARDIVKKADDNQKRFVKDFLWKDAFDLTSFDMIFNTEKLSPLAVAKLIWRAFDMRIESKKQQLELVERGVNIDEFVAKQFQLWREDNPEKPSSPLAKLEDGCNIDYVTFGRDLGAGGALIAQQLAQEIGWDFYDREILNYMSENLNVHVQTLESVDEKTRGSFIESLTNLFNSKEKIAHKEFLKQLGETLMVIAKHGNAVILGRSAGLFLPRDKGLNVFITAPFDLRARRMTVVNNVSLDVAKAQVKKADKELYNFTMDFVGKDIHDAGLYDIICNTEKILPEAFAKIIRRTLEQRQMDES